MLAFLTLTFAILLQTTTGVVGANPIIDAKHHYNHNFKRGAKHVPSQSGANHPYSSHKSEGAVVTIVDVRDYGADASGQTDSTEAVLKAVTDLLSTDGKSDKKMASGIADLGGITLDLAGGVYLMSKPIVIPILVGNIHFIDGTLRASSNFNPAWHLVHIGNTTCAPDNQKSCNEFISFTDVMFDSNFRSAGGAIVQHVMGATFTACFWTGFTGTALQIDGGHEVMVEFSWFAECYWSDSKTCIDRDDSSIAVQINGNDHYLHNVIIFDWVKKGVEVNGEANVLSGVHTWNGGGIGIEVNAGSTRIVGCYLDYNELLIKVADKLLVTDTFFLKTNTKIQTGGAMRETLFKHNVYSWGGEDSGLLSVEIVDVGDADYSGVQNVRFEDEIGEGVLSTARTDSIVYNTSDKEAFVQIDFAGKLVFDAIKSVQHSTVFLGECNSDQLSPLQPTLEKGPAVRFPTGDYGVDCKILITVTVSN
mmetsp:Transcript_19389/g.38744  ORF Transcript_19389/g.38744 Transcript_19389/m.38744 type:complete len:477 (-) Transcript_19389:46-1476(-)